MPSISDISSALGIPVWGVGAAGLCYWVANTVEKHARPKAIRDVAALLQRPAWPRQQHTNRLAYLLFTIFFGARHASLACLSRSFAASVIFVLAYGTYLLARSSVFVVGATFITLKALGPIYGSLDALLFVALCCLIPDYVSLLKTRALLALMQNSERVLVAVLVVLLDMVASALIAYAAFFLGNFAVNLPMEAALSNLSGSGMPEFAWFWMKIAVDPRQFADFFHSVFISDAFRRGGETTLYGLFALSTMLTSIWSILTLLALLLIKALLPLEYIRRVVVWLFPTDDHPMERHSRGSEWIIS